MKRWKNHQVHLEKDSMYEVNPSLEFLEINPSSVPLNLGFSWKTHQI